MSDDGWTRERVGALMTTMGVRDGLTDRLLALLGLDLDFAVSIRRDPFNAITDDVFLGARPERAQIEGLRAAGVTHVVSCLPAEDRERVAFLRDPFETLYIPLRDGMGEDIAASFPAFFEFAQRPNIKLFVHCEVGVSRSATLVTALLMKRERASFFDTYQRVRAKRAEVLPNIGFASQLQQLEFELHPHRKDAPGPSSLARYLREVCTVPADVDTIESMLRDHEHDALAAIEAMFGGEVPRVVQGVRR